MTEILQHCCSTMDEYLSPENYDSGELLEYDASVRRYSFILHEDGERSGWYVPLLYCPWCGEELPRYLGEEWDECLFKELGISVSDPNFGYEDILTLPVEFQTDEWWKKRRL